MMMAPLFLALVPLFALRAFYASVGRAEAARTLSTRTA